MKQSVVKKVFGFCLTTVLSVSMLGVPAEAAKKNKVPALDRTTVQLTVGGTATLTIKKNKNRIVRTDWASNNSGIVSLRSQKKTSVKLNSEKDGSVVVTAVVSYKTKKKAKVKTKRLSCRVECRRADTAIYNSSDSCFEMTFDKELKSLVNEDRHDMDTDEGVWEQSVEMMVMVFPIVGGKVDFNEEVIASRVRLGSDKKTVHVEVDPGKVRKGTQYTILTTGFSYADDSFLPDENVMYFATVKQLPVALEQGETIYETDQNMFLVYFNQNVVNIAKFDKTFPDGEVTYAGQWTKNAASVVKLTDASGAEIGIKEVSSYIKFEDYITIIPEKTLTSGTYTLELTGFAPKSAPTSTNEIKTTVTVK